uniref:NADH-ubiquinone oxidoreductase chain 2 n=1 Tax=Araneus ventricosus TaxID=182803 RepID=A0A0U1XM70_ARAVE|nr:NADH dehydrogenase subunit 2 [Araneus ventricosus]AIU45746.1 NADH dehydrogenase subunit 2 [Araneus ventricosus]
MLAQSVVGFSSFYLASILLTLSCSNWFLVWMGLEINMMSFIAIMYSRSSEGVEVCLKYFFIQGLGSGILMMMFYSEFGWFDYIILMILSYKMGAGPFYFWFPSVCEGLEWGCCFLLMTIQKVLPLLLISFLTSMFLWVIILSSMFIGAAGSMNQESMKRLMAYSSIHHVGWILLGNFLNDILWIVYLITYSFLISGVMLSMMNDKILDVGMLGKISSKWSFVLGMLSMGGMPPMLGFYLKFWLFYNLLFMDYSLLLFMIIMSVLMFYVYLRVVYSVIMSSMNMLSWVSKMMVSSIMSLDLVYMMGVNVGVIVWMMI